MSRARAAVIATVVPLTVPLVLSLATGCSVASDQLELEPVAEDGQELGANLLKNPSFESSTTGWGSWRASVTRIARSGAPHGSYVGKATATTAGAFSLDDNPDAIGNTTKGAKYEASAYVAAATASSVGKAINLVVREKNKSGTTVHLVQAKTTLTTSFKRLTVTKTVQASGNVLDVYVLQEDGVVGSAFYADNLSLASATTTAPPTGPSGEAMPVGNLPGWRQVFTDDFTTNVPLGSFPAAVSAKWGAYPEPARDTSKNGVYAPRRVVSIHDGVLDKYIHTENGVPLVAAILPKIPGANEDGGLKYGRYAVRFKADPIPDYKVAWLLWPDSETWPRDGEIDFPEGDLDGTIGAFMHRQNGTSGGDQDWYRTTSTFTSWHTAIIEWSANRCSFILDGKTVGTSTSRVPSTSMHWVLQSETALGGSKPSASASGHILIDWVAVYVPD